MFDDALVRFVEDQFRLVEDPAMRQQQPLPAEPLLFYDVRRANCVLLVSDD